MKLPEFAYGCICALTLMLLPASNLRGQDSTATDYDRDIKPLLEEKCIACHGVLKQEAGLRLDHGSFIRQGSESGLAVVTSDQESPVIERVTSRDIDLRMPPEGQGAALTAEQVQVLAAWLEQGAPTPSDEPLPIAPQFHWAWQPMEPPRISDEARNPIDVLLERKLNAQELTANAAAAPRARVRRLYFDLIGLPPTPKTLRDFEADPSEQAWSDIVEDLLARPAHGERWARHWMDIWRYSDWDGYKNDLRGSQRHIWRWRDWIVESLNDDKGYDRMITEMLAGDEISPEDPNTLRATGYLARNYHKSNRNIWLDATVEHTAKAFLALTLNCARCHDHKYDPISQRDYYAFRAIFEPYNVRTERLEGQADLMQDGLVRVFDAKPEEATFLFTGGNEKLPQKEHPIAPNTPTFGPMSFEVRPVELPPVAVFPSLRSFIKREDIELAKQKLTQAEAGLSDCQSLPQASERDQRFAASEFAAASAHVRQAKTALRSLRKRWKADEFRFGHNRGGAQVKDDPDYMKLRRRAAIAESQAKIADAQWKLKSQQHSLLELELAEEPDNKAIEKAEQESERLAKLLHSLEESGTPEKFEYTSVGTAYPQRSTGRRKALAEWIANPANPLTARVAANYVWMFHFGQPLVDNVFDFGMRSSQPDHLELLDFLAVELINHNWSLKHLHRLIVGSQAYQRSSLAGSDVNQQRDPDNHFYWRANIRRLEAEVVRDTLLEVSGTLDHRRGGPELDFRQGEEIPRRSLYFRTAYEKQMTMLVLFDAAAPNECYRRSESIIPQQALALSNSALSFDQARRLAAQVWPVKTQRSADEEAKKINLAFEILLGRPCTADELRHCQHFLVSQQKLFSDTTKLQAIEGGGTSKVAPSGNPSQRARENLIHALMNHNDFVTVR